MQITNAEWKIMSLLWERPMTIMEITAALKEETGWTKHTVINLLKRMVEKGTVVYTESGRTKMFSPEHKSVPRSPQG